MAAIGLISVINHYHINGLHLFWETLYITVNLKKKWQFTTTGTTGRYQRKNDKLPPVVHNGQFEIWQCTTGHTQCQEHVKRLLEILFLL